MQPVQGRRRLDGNTDSGIINNSNSNSDRNSDSSVNRRGLRLHYDSGTSTGTGFFFLPMMGADRLEDLNDNFARLVVKARPPSEKLTRTGIEPNGGGDDAGARVQDSAWFSRVDARLRRFGYSLRRGFSAEAARASVLAPWELQ